MKQINLTFELGHEALRTPEEVSFALAQFGLQLLPDGEMYGTVRDSNLKVVGLWQTFERDIDPVTAAALDEM